jgi:hypothetical protein
MSTPLSREQVESLKPLSTYDVEVVRLDARHRIAVGIYTALAIMIDHDAALRAQLAQVTTERDEAETRNENYRLKLNARDQQLAQAQATIERLQHAAHEGNRFHV